MIIPTWKRFKSWSMPTKIAVIGVLLTFIGVISSFFLNSSSINNVDSSTINNQIDSSTTNIYPDESDDKIKENNTLVFSLLGVNNSKLKKLIKNFIKISFDKDSKNVIEISQTGEIQLLSEHSDSYIYTGGVVSVLINNNSCFEFEDYQIPAMRANPKSVIMNELNRVISSYVEENVNEFSKRIVQCIKG